MKRFQKAVGRSAQFFFPYFFAKITWKMLKNHNFFLLTSLEIFHWNFCPKNGWFYIFFLKKKSANGKKAVGRASRTGFYFSWPYFLFFFNFLDLLHDDYHIICYSTKKTQVIVGIVGIDSFKKKKNDHATKIVTTLLSHEGFQSGKKKSYGCWYPLWRRVAFVSY